MNVQQLFDQIKKKGSFLCVGLDTDVQKIPAFLLETTDPVFAFNKEIIDSTSPYAVAYKPNLAFYESLGLKGWNSLEKTVHYIRENYPEIFIIADAKRGDIGNSSRLYAQAFLDPSSTLDFDAVTVAPYMGEDSVTPFLSYENKWVILLALTSNKGAFDFQLFQNSPEQKLYQQVLERSSRWGNEDNLMYVVGATKAEMLADIRKIVPNHFLLVPGVGAQGGSLAEVAKYGLTKDCGLLINASRSIIFASSGTDFAERARAEALRMQQEMKAILENSFKG
jgi:orotidine-5'-phosphate decarboxylase